MPMSREEAEAAARAIMDAELRKAVERQQRGKSGWRAQAIFSTLGLLAGNSLAPGFDGSPIAWGAGGLVAGYIVAWFFKRAVNARRSRG